LTDQRSHTYQKKLNELAQGLNSKEKTKFTVLYVFPLYVDPSSLIKIK